MDTSRQKHNKKNRVVPFCLTAFIMFGSWVLFSGKFDLFHLLMGMIACGIVSFISNRLLFPKALSARLFYTWAGFIRYLPWLFHQIFLSNLHLLYLTFHPKMMTLINPKVIRFDSRLKSDVSRTTLANSITLTPGTITVHAGVMGSFAVHCIDDQSGRDLPGAMEEKIASVFDE